MSVSDLEQRFTPLTFSQSVWQPWGPAGRYQMDEDDDESDDVESILSRSNMRRAHSWSGYTSHALRSYFGNDAAPIEGSEQSERMDESDNLTEDGDCSSSDCGTLSLEGLEASDGRILDDGQTWVSTGLLEDPDRQMASAWRALSTVQMWFQHGSPPDFHVGSSEIRLEHVALDLDYEFTSESTDSTYLSESGTAQYSSEGTEVGHWCAPEGMSPIELDGAEVVEHSKSASSDATEIPSEMPVSSGAAGSCEQPAKDRRCKRNRRGKKLSKARSDNPTDLVTTLMVQNLPYGLSREELLEGIHRSGYAELYNFCHLPRTFKTGKNQGFAFINFVSPEAAQRFSKEWHGNRSFLNLSNSCRPLRIKIANVQGIEACEKIAQSSKMQKVKMGTFKPLIIRRAPDATDSTVA